MNVSKLPRSDNCASIYRKPSGTATCRSHETVKFGILFVSIRWKLSQFFFRWTNCMSAHQWNLQKCWTSCRRRPPRYTPSLSSHTHRGRRSASGGRADGNVAAVSHGQHVPTLTAAAALRVKAALSKAAWLPWPLTFWLWKWCPSHVWSGLSLCQFWSS